MDVKKKWLFEWSVEELEALKNERVYSLEIESSNSRTRYSVDELIPIKKKILKIVEKAPKPALDDPDREKKIFAYVYVVLANMIEYDEQASKAMDMNGYYRERAYDDIERAKGLNGLVTGKALCSGYSNILMNILFEFGIETRYISASGKEGMHAWNQVCLDGVWYNCDLTNDSDFILCGLKAPYFLKSHAEFGEGETHKYTQYSSTCGAKFCKESVSDEKQELLIEEAKEIIEKERIRMAEIRTQKEAEQRAREEEVRKSKGFIGMLKSFFEKVILSKKEKNTSRR